MVDAIRTIQEQGIVVLSSLICGLESDTVESLRQMRQLALESGSMMAQFALYNPYPGTHDYYSMIEDRKHRGTANYVPKHRTRLVVDRFWLTDTGPADVIEHPTLTREELLRENRLSWNAFYALPQIVKRSRQGVGRKWPLMAKITYVIFSVMFRRVYGGNGLVADIVHKRTIGRGTKVVIAICMACWKAALAQSRASGRGRRQIA